MHRMVFIETDATLAGALTRLLNVYDISVQSYRDTASWLATPQDADTGCVLVSELALPVEAIARQLGLESFCRDTNRLPIILVIAKANRFVRASALQTGVTGVIERQVLAAFLRRRLVDLQIVEPGFEHPELITLENGLTVGFRIMQPEDAAIEQAFVRGLSMRSRYTRFFSPITELSPVWLERFTHATFPADNALIAAVQENSQEKIIGVARYGTSEKDGVVDFAVVVADDWQRLGLASRLMSGLVMSATIGGIDVLTGLVLPENQAMLQLARSFGFKSDPNVRDPDGVHIAKVLRQR